MTPRERLVAAARGGEVDRQPRIGWPGTSEGSDALVVAALPQDAEAEQAVLAEVANPFGRALVRGTDLNTLLREDPAKGADLLDLLVAETRDDMAIALSSGADGILYRLHGANPDHCSPMQYGGHYLERDRELLEEIADARVNLLFVVGDRELYLDFVSDLPAHLFGWDDRTSGISTEAGRALRGGAVATFDLGSDVLLTTTLPSVAQFLEKPRSESAV